MKDVYLRSQIADATWSEARLDKYTEILDAGDRRGYGPDGTMRPFDYLTTVREAGRTAAAMAEQILAARKMPRPHRLQLQAVNRRGRDTVAAIEASIQLIASVQGGMQRRGVTDAVSRSWGLDSLEIAADLVETLEMDVMATMALSPEYKKGAD